MAHVDLDSVSGQADVLNAAWGEGTVMRIVFAVALCAFGVWGAEPAAAADIVAISIPCEQPSCVSQTEIHIEVTGSIQRGDFESIKSILANNQETVTTLLLNSPGGNVEEALQIGKLARTYMLRTIAPMDLENGRAVCTRFGTSFVGSRSECNCASACALIFAGGVQRHGSIIGLHRPHFPAEFFAQLDAAAAEEKYHALTKRIEYYLSEMSVSPLVYVRMLQTSSGDIDYLSLHDIDELFGRIAPSTAEWLRARCGEAQEMRPFRLQNAATLKILFETYGYNENDWPVHLRGTINNLRQQVTLPDMIELVEVQQSETIINKCRDSSLMSERRRRLDGR